MSTSPSTGGGMSAPIRRRYGCFPMVIGAMTAHRLDANITLPSRRLLKAGQIIHLSLEDITRHPETDGHVKWICKNPGCAHERWASKKELLAAHPNNRDLERVEETHCFYAFANLPGVEAKPEKTAKDGSILEEAVEAKLPSIVLLSDEE